MSGDPSFTPTRQPPVSGGNGHTSGKTKAPSSQASSPPTGKTNGRRVATNGRAAPTRAAAGAKNNYRAQLARLRDEACERARPLVNSGAAPIRDRMRTSRPTWRYRRWARSPVVRKGSARSGRR